MQQPSPPCWPIHWPCLLRKLYCRHWCRWRHLRGPFFAVKLASLHPQTWQLPCDAALSRVTPTVTQISVTCSHIVNIHIRYKRYSVEFHKLYKTPSFIVDSISYTFIHSNLLDIRQFYRGNNNLNILFHGNSIFDTNNMRKIQIDITLAHKILDNQIYLQDSDMKAPVVWFYD